MNDHNSNWIAQRWILLVCTYIQNKDHYIDVIYIQILQLHCNTQRRYEIDLKDVLMAYHI